RSNRSILAHELRRRHESCQRRLQKQRLVQHNQGGGADDQIDREQQDQKERELAHRKPAGGGAGGIQDRNQRRQTEQSQGDLDRRKFDYGPVAQQVSKVSNRGGSEEGFCGRQRNQKGQH